MILLDEKGLHAILRCAKIIFLEIDTYYESSPLRCIKISKDRVYICCYVV